MKNLMQNCLMLLALSLFIPANGQSAERRRVDLSDVKVKKLKKRKVQAAPEQQKSAIYFDQVEKRVIKGIDVVTRRLRKTAKSMPKRSNTRLQLLTRILNLRIDQAKHYRNQEEATYDKGWKRWSLKGAKGKAPTLNTRKSNKAWKKVIKETSGILREYPRNKKADMMIFNKGLANQFLGKEKEAARIFTKLIQTYPNSNIAGEAYAALGDFYFDNNDFRNAQNNYQSSMKYKRSKRYLWSLFRLGWCKFNLNRFRDTMRLWKKVVKEAKRMGSKGVTLKDEALRDLVYVFAELGDVDGALAYYRAHGGQEYMGGLLMLLSNTFINQGQYKKAVLTLNKFQKLFPRNPKAPGAQESVIELHFELRKMTKVWAGLELYGKRYGPKSGWYRANKKDRELVLTVEKKMKDNFIYYSKVLHRQAMKDGSRSAHIEARRGYMMFLKYYPRAREVVEVKELLADIEYFLKRYEQAGNFYLEIGLLGKKKAVVYEKGKKPRNIHKQVSIFMVGAFEEDFKNEFKALVKSVKKPNFKKPRKISRKARNYVKACAKYQNWYKNDKQRVKTCQINTTKLYYFSGDKKNAMNFLWLIAKKYANDKKKIGHDAVSKLMPLYKGQKEAQIAAADKLLKIPAYRKGELGKKLRQLKQDAEIDQIVKEKDAGKKAKKFELQAKKYPKHPEADKYWNNAAVSYLKAGMVPNAIAAYNSMIKRYPKSKLTSDATLELAILYETRLSFSKAIGAYNQFAARNPKRKEVADAVHKTCQLNLLLGSRNALASCKNLAKYNKASAKYYIKQLIKKAYRDGSLSTLSSLVKKHYLNSYKVSANEAIIAQHRIARLAGKGSAAASANRAILTAYKRNPKSVDGEALRYVGEIYFRRANSKMGSFLKTKLVGGSVENLAKSRDVILGAMNKTVAGYQDVLNLSDAYWGVAALHQKGVIYEHVGKQFSNPPAIKGATKTDVVKQFKDIIDQSKGEAANSYKLANSTVTKFQVYNKWSVKVLNSLARIKGSDIRLDDWVDTPDFVGSEVSTSVARAVSGGR